MIVGRLVELRVEPWSSPTCDHAGLCPCLSQRKAPPTHVPWTFTNVAITSCWSLETGGCLLSVVLTTLGQASSSCFPQAPP